MNISAAPVPSNLGVTFLTCFTVLALPSKVMPFLSKIIVKLEPAKSNPLSAL